MMTKEECVGSYRNRATIAFQRAFTGFLLLACVAYGRMQFVLAAQAGEAAASEVAARAAVKQRHERLRNLVVEYDRLERHAPARNRTNATNKATVVEGGEITVSLQGVVTSKDIFRFLDGHAYYEARVSPAGHGTAADHAFQHTIRGFSKERAETLWRPRHESLDHGIIATDQPLPRNSAIDYALGLRECNGVRWMPASTWAEVSIEQHAASVDFRRKNDKGPIVHVWTADPKYGYAFVHYVVLYKGSISYEVVADDFRPVDGLKMPYSVTLSAYGPGGRDAGAVTSVELRIASYKIGDPQNTPERFLIQWPKGAVVSDQRNGAVIRVDDGPRPLDDSYLQALARGRGLSMTHPTRGTRLWLVLISAGGLLIASVVLIRRLWRRPRRV